MVIWIAELLGVFILPWFCLANAWTPPNLSSTKPWPSGIENRGPERLRVDQWKWQWLNKWYGNVEDGVSGQQAYVWDPSGKLVPYSTLYPDWTPKWCIAFGWSVWRNGANNAKRAERNDSWSVPPR